MLNGQVMFWTALEIVSQGKIQGYLCFYKTVGIIEYSFEFISDKRWIDWVNTDENEFCLLFDILSQKKCSFFSELLLLNICNVF